MRSNAEWIRCSAQQHKTLGPTAARESKIDRGNIQQKELKQQEDNKLTASIL
jgi:hypothetical protein